MKVFQVMNEKCHWDASGVHASLAETVGRYAPNIVFVEAPDYVFESWGFDSTKEGDDRFIRPETPEGFLYDEATGTFYPEDMGGPEPTIEEILNALLGVTT